MDDKIRLDLIGITYNQIESGVYAVILQQHDGTRRIPIIIGYPEAQAIECRLQNVRTPRPLTHDMAVGILNGFNIRLKEIIIKRLDNGVFTADLVLQSDNETVIIDSRSSDAIALAIRVGAPIYTYSSVLMEAGFDPQQKSQKDSSEKTRNESRSIFSESKGERITDEKEEIEDASLEELEKRLKTAVDKEDYIEASRIKKEIDRRSGTGQ